MNIVTLTSTAPALPSNKRTIMKLEVLGSGSKGNCYILRPTSGKCLIIEAGVRWRDVKKAMHFDINAIEACIVSHSHGDHAGHVEEMLNACVTVGASAETFKAGGWGHKVFQTVIKPRENLRFGEFGVYAFDLRHDVPCLGFIITHKEMGRLAFVTDTMLLPYRLPNINHWLIEANYSDAILTENIEAGRVPASMRERLLHSHMELETTVKALQANDMEGVKNIVLIHLSDANSYASVFKMRVEEATGKPVSIASAGVEMDLTA